MKCALSKYITSEFCFQKRQSSRRTGNRSKIAVSYVRVGQIDDAEDRSLVPQIDRRTFLLHGFQKNRQAIVKMILLTSGLGHREHDREQARETRVTLVKDDPAHCATQIPRMRNSASAGSRCACLSRVFRCDNGVPLSQSNA